MTNRIADAEISQQVARDLLNIEAVKLSPERPFTWASGWNSPIYCDNRLTLGYPEIRKNITHALVKLVRSRHPGCEAVAGVATAGIPQGVLVADTLNLPFLYVRSKPKGHGMENLIEGHVVKGLKVVVVEDLISTGGSSLKAVKALRERELDVLGLIAVFTYGFKAADESFQQQLVDFQVLTDYSSLLSIAREQGLVKEDQVDLLKSWREEPETWPQSQ